MDLKLDQDLLTAEGYSREVAQLEKIQEIIRQDGEIADDYLVLNQIIKSLEINGFLERGN